MSTVELDRPPALSTLYRRAVLGAVTRRSGDTLPDDTLVLRGIEVERAHLAGYDRVCGFPLTDALPATYPHVLAFPVSMALMCRPDFPFPLAGLVHVANRITPYRRLDAGEPLDIAVQATDLRPHDRGRQLDVVTVATVDGAEVWREVSTYLRREGDTGQRDERREPEPPPRPSALWTVDESVGTGYARASGDHNPIHTSRLGARVFGFRRPIAHGMWSLARCLAQLTGRLGEAYTVDASFKLPIQLPAKVAFSAATAVAGAGPGWSFALHDARTGRPHLTGTITG